MWSHSPEKLSIRDGVALGGQGHDLVLGHLLNVGESGITVQVEISIHRRRQQLDRVGTPGRRREEVAALALPYLGRDLVAYRDLDGLFRGALILQSVILDGQRERSARTVLFPHFDVEEVSAGRHRDEVALGVALVRAPQLVLAQRIGETSRSAFTCRPSMAMR